MLLLGDEVREYHRSQKEILPTHWTCFLIKCKSWDNDYPGNCKAYLPVDIYIDEETICYHGNFIKKKEKI